MATYSSGGNSLTLKPVSHGDVWSRNWYRGLGSIIIYRSELEPFASSAPFARCSQMYMLPPLGLIVTLQISTTGRLSVHQVQSVATIPICCCSIQCIGRLLLASLTSATGQLQQLTNAFTCSVCCERRLHLSPRDRQFRDANILVWLGVLHFVKRHCQLQIGQLLEDCAKDTLELCAGQPSCNTNMGTIAKA